MIAPPPYDMSQLIEWAANGELAPLILQLLWLVRGLAMMVFGSIVALAAAVGFRG